MKLKLDGTGGKQEVDLNHRLSYIPIPVAHVLRDSKKYLVDAKDIIVGDLVYLDAKVSGVIPADIILCDTSDDLEISSYINTFDQKNYHFKDQRLEDYEPVDTSTKKFAKILEAEEEPDPDAPHPTDFILDSPNFVAMGSRLLSGQAKGICIKIGNDTIKALLK